MSVDIKKLNPWNWFRDEQQQEERAVAVQQKQSRAGALPSLYSDHPLLSLHRELDRLFDNAFRRFNTVVPDVPGTALLKPSVDIRENRKNYKITVEVPGVEENDVKLELSDRTLTISGEKTYEKEEKDENHYCVERSYGSFRRVLDLPEDIDRDGIEAKFRNGVLTIMVPRKQMAKSKEAAKMIEITHAA